jgi:hypothetical protein
MKTVSTDLPVGRAEKGTVDRMPGIALGVLALIIAGLAISSQSFWIDESSTASKAILPDLASWWKKMADIKGSDLQMPFYMWYVWVWEKIFGHGEWWTRASGIPWLITGLYFFAGRRAERWIVVIFSAFTWYCLNEARPYAMQLGASLAIFAAIEQLAENSSPENSRSEGLWLAVLLVGVIALSGSSLLGMIWAGTALAAFVSVQAGKDNAWKIVRAHKTLWITSGLFLTALAVFYLWSIHQGAGASNAGGTDWRNVLFVIFEVLGFSGLGPGRLELRFSGAGALRPYILPLAIITASTAIVAGTGLWQARKRIATRRGLALTLVVCGAAMLLLAIGLLKSFRILGRHFTPVAPVVFWLLAGGIFALWQDRGFLKRVIVVTFLIASGASCLSLRLAPRHAKDDYRGAAAIARAADQPSGAIYGVRMPDTLARDAIAKVEPDSAIFIWNVPGETLSTLPVPDLVFVSKPDIFDHPGSVTRFVEQHHYTRLAPKQAFEIWKRPDTGTP